MHEAVQTSNYGRWKDYAQLVNTRPAATLRDLLTISGKAQPIDIDNVEPIESILKRFDSAGMSLGALSPEAHESLAEAMNTLGGRSTQERAVRILLATVRLNRQKLSRWRRADLA